MIETVGYLMVSEAFRSVDHQPGEVMLGLGFLPMRQVDGKAVPWSDKQQAEMQKLGFKAVCSIRADVAYEGSKIHHNGCEILFLASVSDELEARVREIPPDLVLGLMNDFYAGLPSNKKGKK